MKLLLLAAALGFPQQIIDLNCMEALVAIEQPKLAGVFSFISEKESTHAFANLLANDKKLQKKFVAKVESDFAKARGITVWDHEVLLNLVSLLGSPLGPSLDQPKEKLKNKMIELSMAPTLSLEEVALRRKQP